MEGLVKQVFLIIGALVASLLLFVIVLGDEGKGVIWANLEPTFQTNWERNTLEDGNLVSERLKTTFDGVVEVTQFQ